MKVTPTFSSTTLASLTLVSTFLYSAALPFNGWVSAHEAEMRKPAAGINHQHGSGETHTHKTRGMGG